MALSQKDIDDISASSGQSLVRHFWGGYIAFLSGRDDTVAVLRDPSGIIPAYWREHGQGIAVGCELGLPPFTAEDGLRLDAEALTSFLYCPARLDGRTCIAGVTELLAGQAMLIRHGTLRVSTYWSPWDHVLRGGWPNEVDPELLFETIDDTIRSWGRCYSSVLVGLSGGLDSSIVSSALAGSGCTLHGLTMIGPDRDGDESHYARQAAEAFGMGWNRVAYRLEDVAVDLPVATHVSRPFLSHYVQAIAQAHDRLSLSAIVDAYVSGNGGDNVLCLMRSVTPLIDRIKARSNPMACLRTMADIATLTEADVVTVLRSALSRLRRDRAPSAFGADPSFLSQERLDSICCRADLHPWIDAPAGVLPGAISHVSMVRRAHGNDGFHSRRTHAPAISPLLSQPIVELCLGIPSWAWIEGGRDRAVARKAFQGRVPQALLDRRSKGGPGGFVDLVYRHNEKTVLSILRGGVLRELGIIDDIQQWLSQIRDHGAHPFLPHRLLALTAAETWARLWTGSRTDRSG